MNLTCPRTIVLLAALGIIWCGKSFAQNPGPRTGPSNLLAVTVESASGRQRHAEVHFGAAARVGLRPGQEVKLKLRFHGRGEAVTVSPLDGGTVEANGARGRTGDGNVEFIYKAGTSPGRYRVLVRDGADEYWLEFYVVDLTNPRKNPPRVRVVD